MLLTLLLVPFLVSSTFNIFVYTTKDVSHNHIIIYIAYSVNIWIYMHKLCCLDIYFIAHRYFRSESGIVFLSCRSTFQAKMKWKLPPNLQLAGQVQYMTDFNTLSGTPSSLLLGIFFGWCGWFFFFTLKKKLIYFSHDAKLHSGQIWALILLETLWTSALYPSLLDEVCIV